MKELLVITKIKKFIVYIDKILINYPKDQIEVKNNIKTHLYLLLEYTYKGNIFKDDERVHYQKLSIIEVKLIDFYFKYSLDLKIINFERFKKIANHLLEITKLLYGWLSYEKNK